MNVSICNLRIAARRFLPAGTPWQCRAGAQDLGAKKRSSWEIITQLFMDTTGIAYGLVLGFDKAWPFVVLLCCTFLARSVNGFVYLRYRETAS